METPSLLMRLKSGLTTVEKDSGLLLSLETLKDSVPVAK